jgi:hypothetical protein
MANAYKVLGQTGDASTAVDIYTTSGVEAIVSTIVVCNRSAATKTFDISVRPAGATEANEHYIVKGTSIAANDSITLTLGITLADTDVVTVTASTADVSFSVFGTEIS